MDDIDMLSRKTPAGARWLQYPKVSCTRHIRAGGIIATDELPGGLADTNRRDGRRWQRQSSAYYQPTYEEYQEHSSAAGRKFNSVPVYKCVYMKPIRPCDRCIRDFREYIQGADGIRSFEGKYSL